MKSFAALLTVLGFVDAQSYEAVVQQYNADGQKIGTTATGTASTPEGSVTLITDWDAEAQYVQLTMKGQSTTCTWSVVTKGKPKALAKNLGPCDYEIRDVTKSSQSLILPISQFKVYKANLQIQADCTLGVESLKQQLPTIAESCELREDANQIFYKPKEAKTGGQKSGQKSGNATNDTIIYSFLSAAQLGFTGSQYCTNAALDFTDYYMYAMSL